MQPQWHIQRRSNCCSATNKPFADGEIFHTQLFREKSGLRREDLSEEAWASRTSELLPFSYWKSKYEKSISHATPDPMARESVEDLLRRLTLDDEPHTLHVRYILVLMLERKRILKPVDEKPSDEGRLLIYEHTKTGEAFLVIDPQLRLDQIESIQTEVFDLLKGMTTPPAEAFPPSQTTT